MNIQSANQRSTRTKVRTPQHSPVSGKLAMVGKFLFAAAAVAALLNVYIQRQIRKTERVLHETEREIAQLRIQREQLMAWPHIKNMIARFDLKLHGPNPGQVATMSILTPDQAARIPLESVAAVRTPGSGVIRN
mgnify:CR=1 FL=1